ncbi:MAG: hypothetical protein AB2693_21395 [Candidatus Thiodiazotropha sp.]
MSTSVKRAALETEDRIAPPPKLRLKRVSEEVSEKKEETGVFSTDRVTVDSLVNETRGLKEALNKQTKAGKRFEKLFTEIICVTAKLTDAFNRLKTHRMIMRAERREERRQEAERRKEDEWRREREEDMRREERRREMDRK